MSTADQPCADARTEDAAPADGFKLNLTARLVAAVAQFRPLADIRYYLNGVYVQPIPGGGALLVATNGHALCLWRDVDGEIERPAILRIGKKLETACKGKLTKRLKIVDDRLVVQDEFGGEQFVQQRDSISMKVGDWEVPGKYPSWAAVTPEAQTEPLVLDSLAPEYVAMCSRALTIGLGKGFNAVTFKQATTGAGISVTCPQGGNFYAVIMPMRENIGVYPEWLATLHRQTEVPATDADAPASEEVAA